MSIISKVFSIILLIVSIVLLMTAIWFFYNMVPGEPVSFGNFQMNEVGVPEVEYGDTPVFLENLRFRDGQITYWIQGSCPLYRQERMNQGFEKLEEEMSFLTFSQVSESDAEIKVGCSEDYLESRDRRFVAGEGGPTKIINTTIFNLILEGKILLYKEVKCDYPVVEVHELLHVLGFGHVNNPSSLMYNFSDCDQRITSDMVSTLQRIYSFDSLPELEFVEIDAIKKGKYLDFNLSVINSGIADVTFTDLTILERGDVVEVFDLNEIEAGTQKSLRVQNLDMGSRGFDDVEFVLDRNEKIKELFEENNVAVLSVED